jgi:tetratricopeptide (TPR) repeat protein
MADPRSVSAQGQFAGRFAARDGRDWLPGSRAVRNLEFAMKRPLISLLACGLAAVVMSLAGLGCATTTGRDPDRPLAVDYYVQAVQAYQGGDIDRAIILLLEATRQNPNLRMAHSLLGDLYRQKGDINQAIPNYEKLTALDPYSPFAHYRLGLAYQLVNRLKEAAASYLRALALDPKDFRSNMNLGLVYLALNQLDDAVTYLERASQLAPENAEIWANLGVALDARGSYVLAEAAYKKSLEIDDSQDAVMLNLGSNLVTQGKAQDALSVMERAMQKSQNPQTRKRYADALALNKNFDEAARQYDLALKTDPRYWPALTEKGFLLIRLYDNGMQLDERQKAAAVELWRRSLALNPAQPRVQAAIDKWSGKGLFGQ